VVDNGAFDWLVTAIHVDAKEARGPMLTGTTEEQGTDFPTVKDPLLDDRFAALRAKDPTFDLGQLELRVGLVFQTMQTAWTSLEWQRARPFLSDNLFEAQRYWIETYRRSGLRNVTERTRITKIELARVGDDAWFDAITLRVHATGLDYTIRDADRSVVGGSRDKERQYTEYWTLLRGRQATGKIHTSPECPRCGAPLQVSMTAECTACKAKVNSGAFDWVLARIEQDDVYTG
jgi:predicted lipid-binding transport protein (Tim44 family)